MVCGRLGCFLVFLGLALATVPPSERNALVDFYNALNGPNWNGKNGWLTGDPCVNRWVGVSCNIDQTTVISLVRQAQNLDGTIPETIGNLTNLQEFFLSFSHNLVGTIPATVVTNLTSLVDFTIEYTGMAGRIPPLGSLPNLTSIFLEGNLFSGPIPDGLFGVAPYRSIYMGANALSGTLPAGFCKASQYLNQLDVGSNYLTGTIPDCWDNLPSLFALELSNNSFTGPVPPTIGKLPKMIYFGMADNSLTGTLPQFLSTTTLEAVYLSNNRISGSLPDWSGFFVPATTESITELYVGHNQLTGTVPDWVCQINDFGLQDNLWSCPFPSCCTPMFCGTCA